MPLQRWLRLFFAFEARDGGALPPPQLFPFLTDTSTTTTTAASLDVADRSDKSEATEAEEEVAATSLSSSSPSATPPPPPPGPPPTTAIAPTRRAARVVRDIGCGTLDTAAGGGGPHSPPRFYSRYVFLHTVTALQLLWGYFSFALWNYLAHIRWYGASAAYVAVSPTGGEGGDEGVGAGPGVLHRVPLQWVAVAYLSLALAGLTYTVAAVGYVCVMNTPCHVRAAWPNPQLWPQACCCAAAPGLESVGARDDDDPFWTYGPVKRQRRRAAGTPASATRSWFSQGRSEGDREYQERRGAPPRPPHPPLRLGATPAPLLPLTFTQPQFLFPLRSLAKLDRAATAANAHRGSDAEVEEREEVGEGDAGMDKRRGELRYHYGGAYREAPHSTAAAAAAAATPSQPFGAPPPRRPSRQHRGDPKSPLLWCAFPLTAVLVVLDLVVVNDCRVRGWPVHLVQGLSPAFGLLLLLFTMKSVAVLCVRCCAALPIRVHAPAQPPMQPGHVPSPPPPWAN